MVCCSLALRKVHSQCTGTLSVTSVSCSYLQSCTTDRNEHFFYRMWCC
uniref:Uncharacterized protein n=1 Tax=Rhizophora mucronata TaxID=61149 RepID=A0A2P2NHF8_RHIMU